MSKKKSSSESIFHKSLGIKSNHLLKAIAAHEIIMSKQKRFENLLLFAINEPGGLTYKNKINSGKLISFK